MESKSRRVKIREIVRMLEDPLDILLGERYSIRDPSQRESRVIVTATIASRKSSRPAERNQNGR
jgi:hypothetical protein